RGPLLHHHHAPLDPVLHEQGPGVPVQGLRTPRRRPGCARAARGEPAGVPAGRADRRGARAAGLSGGPVPGPGDQVRPGEEVAAGRFRLPASGGIIAINLREDDEVIGARLVSPDEDLILVSRGAQAVRFTASDDSLRPMGRATSGVIGMKFRDGDALLAMLVVREGTEDVLVATGNGYAKRTPADQYPLHGRGGLGVVTAKIVEARGELVGALMVKPEDEVFAITSAGGVIRTRAAGVKQSGRQTMGVRLMNLASGDSVVALARNAEAAASDEADEDGGDVSSGEVPGAGGEDAESSAWRGQRRPKWVRQRTWGQPVSQVVSYGLLGPI